MKEIKNKENVMGNRIIDSPQPQRASLGYRGQEHVSKHPLTRREKSRKRQVLISVNCIRLNPLTSMS